MDSETTDQLVAWSKCMLQLVLIRNFQKTQKIVSRGWCLGSKDTDQPVAHTGSSSCLHDKTCDSLHAKIHKIFSEGVQSPRRGLTENSNMAIPGGGGGGLDPLSPLWIRPYTD